MTSRGDHNEHIPTEGTRQTVRLHALVGTRQEVIADVLDIDPKTLRKHYRKELDQALAQANATIGGKLFRKAADGDTSAMIFWLKTRAGFREKSRDEDDDTDTPQPTTVNIKVTDARARD